MLDGAWIKVEDQSYSADEITRIGQKRGHTWYSQDSSRWRRCFGAGMGESSDRLFIYFCLCHMQYFQLVHNNISSYTISQLPKGGSAQHTSGKWNTQISINNTKAFLSRLYVSFALCLERVRSAYQPCCLHMNTQPLPSGSVIKSCQVPTLIHSTSSHLWGPASLSGPFGKTFLYLCTKMSICQPPPQRKSPIVGQSLEKVRKPGWKCQLKCSIASPKIGSSSAPSPILQCDEYA